MPSSPRILILTPAREDAVYEARWTGGFERYRTLFAEAGAEAISAPWPEAATVAADLTLPLLAWGYHFDTARWDALLAAWPVRRAMQNPARLLSWNTRKVYLADLESAGVATIPTLFTDDPSTEDMSALRARFSTDELVVKPQVSAGSHRTLRLASGEAAPEGFGAAMIQPFLPQVAEEGELSLFMIGGAFAYAVRKVATGGDFRVQPQFGGRFALFDPEPEALALAEAAVGACPAPPLYARADMVRGLDGRLQLMELECIEPDLYLDLAPDGGRGFVQRGAGDAHSPVNFTRVGQRSAIRQASHFGRRAMQT